MKCSQIQFSKILLFLSGIILWFFIPIFIYHKSQSNFHKQMATIWEQTIADDSQIRLVETGMEHISHTAHTKDSINSLTKEKGDSVKIKTENGKIVIDKKDVVIPHNEEERKQRKLQHFLYSNNPVRTDRLDSLFQVNLHKKGFSVPSAVSYSQRDSNRVWEHQLSCPIESLLSWNRITTYKIETSIDNSIILYGHTELSWMNYLWNEIGLFTLWGCSSLIILLLIGIYRKRPAFKILQYTATNRLPLKEQPPLIILPNKQAEKQAEKTYKIIYHSHNRQLVYGKSTVTFTPQQGLLFYSILTGENYQRDYDDLIQIIWPNGEGSKKKLEQLQKALRDRLKPMPIRIEVIRATGYCLKMDNPYSIVEE
jgi:hypothetical protein